MPDIQLQRGLQKLGGDEEFPPRGKLGYTIKGVFRVRVLGNEGKYYVHFPDGRFITAFHGDLNVSEDISSSTISVELEKHLEEYYIKGVSGSERTAIEQHNPEIYSHAYAHTHPITDMEWISAHLFTAGNILISDGAHFNSVPQSALAPSASSGLTISGIQTISSTTTDALWVGPVYVTGILTINGILRII